MAHPRGKSFKTSAVAIHNSLRGIRLLLLSACLSIIGITAVSPAAFAQPLAPPPPPPGSPFLPPMVQPGVQVVPIAPVSPLGTVQEFPTVSVEPEKLYQGEVHLELSETLLHLLLRKRDTTTGTVQDVVSGVAVSGMQTTTTSVSIDCIPSVEGAKFLFIVQGLIQSETSASTPQANILQSGNTHFRANKQVLLDGENILTQKAVIQVLPNQTIVGAKSRPRPVLGNLADKIAYKAAQARLPEINMLAAQRASERLQPQIDSQIDQNLAEANKLVRQNLWNRLKEWGVLPQRKAAFSSHHRLHWDYRLGDQPISWTRPLLVPHTEPSPFNSSAQPPSETGDVVVRIHDSLFSTVAARRQLGGKTISLNELREATDQLLILFAEEIPDQSPSLPLAVTFTFDRASPLKANFDDNQLELILRGTFQAGTLPQTELQQLRFALTSTLEPESVTIKVTEVSVHEVGADGSLQEPGITQSAIANQLRSQTVPIKLKRETRLPANLSGSMHLDLTQMLADDHWLTIHLKARPSVAGPPLSPGSPLPTPDPAFQPGPAFQPAPTFQSAPSFQPGGFSPTP